MKVTFVEEIEAHKAWRKSMACPCCGEPKYNIHHQLQPEEIDCWWVACPECEHEGPPSLTKEIAIARWKQKC